MNLARFWPFLLQIVLLALILISPARADLRTPTWWNNSTAPAPSSWHYRVPIAVPAGSAINATIRTDVDFNALLATMGVSGTFDANSPRVVRSSGALSTLQEFTDTVYAGATDTAGNGRGEVRFILQDAGATTYYLYFDVTQNGVKAANPQTPINGNFEFGAVGTATPPGWTTSSKVDPALDIQIRGSESPSITTDGAAPAFATVTTDGTPRTGAQSYLIGSRTNNENSTLNSKNATLLDRSITVPAGAAAGNLTVRWRPEGWDSDINGGASGFDHFKVSIVTAGGAVTQIIGPTAGSYATNPFSPDYGTGAITATASGYGQYNTWDMGTNQAHTLGMTVGFGASPWWTLNYNLSAFAGQTVTLRIETANVNLFRTWASVDDVEWSVTPGTLGAPEAFGVNITAPAASSTFTTNQTITVTVQTDAAPTSATPMTIGIYSPAGVLLSGPITLYNNATNGDATSGDNIWTNNAVVIPTAAAASGYVIRAFGRDLTTSTIGASAGIARGPGTGAATETQANFWNIDEILFNINTAALTVTKTSSVVSDPINGTTNPKMIPGATVRYCILVSNAGPLAATSVVGTDPLPSTVLFTAGTIKSGTSCATATTSGGATFAGTTLTINIANLASGASQAVTFDAVVQ